MNVVRPNRPRVSAKMLTIYSLLIFLAFLLMSPLLLVRREKYMSGFGERLGNYPAFSQDGRRVIWLHCVSVGETNAARPLVDALLKEFPSYRLIVSTTTKTGNDLAKSVFKDKADAVFHFPFDLQFCVRRALRHFKPTAVLLMETEIWPRFLHEAKKENIKTAIVNGRLSERSVSRYSWAKPFIRNVLQNVDLALMQGDADAARIAQLGIAPNKIEVTGNLKFDHAIEPVETDTARMLDDRFALSGTRPLIVAASTHEPEEDLVLDAFCSLAVEEALTRPRLMIAPRHPERFDAVAKMIEAFRTDSSCEWPDYTVARRSSESDESDADADIILLDTIGELRSVYTFAEIVFVGGSLIPHGGQSVFEPAAAGKAIITGHHTHNFADAVKILLENNAILQLPDKPNDFLIDEVFDEIHDLFEFPDKRDRLGRNAAAAVDANKGAVRKTAARLRMLLSGS